MRRDRMRATRRVILFLFEEAVERCLDDRNHDRK